MAGAAKQRLERYRKKRSADRTPEPFGGEGEGEPAPETPSGPPWRRRRLFCVQKHAARRLHYDFRLELGGVLLSWAVPKGPSADPAEKRLAVEVEDHPVEYADFEGIIPEGNYGAGAVIVWDKGTWLPHEDREEGMKQGKLTFELFGYKLRGLWHLFRTKKQQGESPKEWLLIKKPDAWAGAESARALTPESIYSGLTIEELQTGGERALEIREELLKLGAPRKRVDVAKVGLMLAESRDEAWSAPNWLFELKYDGYRILAAREKGEARLLFRRGSLATSTFPEIARAVSGLPFDGLVLDGEVVVLDDDARASFARLQKRALLQRTADIARAASLLPATYCVFDLLGFEDFDLRGLPLRTRKALLRRILPRAGPLRYSDHVEEQGEAFFAGVREMRLEGVVAKQADSPYKAGRSSHWIKLRIEKTGDFVVCGLSPPEGMRSGFGALHIAAYENGRLTYAGRVGSGFSERDLKDVPERLAPFIRKTPPCEGEVPKGSRHAWVEPREVCEVRYLERLPGRMPRQPVFVRFRGDKRPEECVRERVAEEPLPEPSSPEPSFEKKVALSNLGKVFWPDEGYTKGDLIEYYRSVAPWLLRYLRDRPVVLTRYPDGIGGKSFFQKVVSARTRGSRERLSRKMKILQALGFLALAAVASAEGVTVRRAAGPIGLDGDLSDPGWQGAASIDTFYETQPADNVPPKVKTVAYVTYDDKALFIGLRCEDPEPAKIRAPFVDRDQVLGTDDNVAVFLDTRNDRRSAVELRVNPRGIQGDAVWNDANFNEDFSPDFFYDTAARVTDFGWSAEMRIPFTSLRYPRADSQTWGILVWRNYPRDFRYFIHSNRVPRGSNCLICHAQPMTGLTGLPHSGGLVVAPYATAQEVATAPVLGEPLGDGDTHADVGLDVKWTPSATTALDATVNPDFSQVEADVAQIAVNNRFALFFPEKRPFFLEGVDLFDTPIQAVYTRTITSPRWGARGTGKIGSTAYTVLLAQDRGGGSAILPGPISSDLAPQDFRSIVAIGRLRRDVGTSFVGLLVTDREIEDGGYNRVLGPDFQWRPSDKDQVTGQLLRSESETPLRPADAEEWDGRRLGGWGLEASWFHSTQAFQSFVGYRDFANGFRADDGFVPQVGYRSYAANSRLKFYPQGLLRLVFPYAVAEYVVDRGGDLIERNVIAGFFAQGRRNLATYVELNFNRVRAGSDVLPQTNLSAGLQLDPSRRVVRLSVNGTIGQAVDFAHARRGHGGNVTGTATLRPTVHLTLDLTSARRWLDVDPGSGRSERLFTAQVQRLKAVYNFSARSFLRLIGQWVETTRAPALYAFPVDDRSGSFSGSALFVYKLNWQTALYLGYGDDRALDERDDLQKAGRQLFVKLSYAFQR